MALTFTYSYMYPLRAMLFYECAQRPALNERWWLSPAIALRLVYEMLSSHAPAISVKPVSTQWLSSCRIVCRCDSPRRTLVVCTVVS